MSWRDILKVHPAALVLPPLSDYEKAALRGDIKANGLRVEPVWRKTASGPELIDGVHRLDACEALGWTIQANNNDLFIWSRSRAAGMLVRPTKSDPAQLVVSLNLRRRQVATREQTEALTIEVLRAHPEWSDRKVGKIVGKDGKTVAATRAKAEARAEIPHAETRMDTKGRAQPATKPPTKTKPPKAIKAADEGRYTPDVAAAIKELASVPGAISSLIRPLPSEGLSKPKPAAPPPTPPVAPIVEKESIEQAPAYVEMLSKAQEILDGQKSPQPTKAPYQRRSELFGLWAQLGDEEKADFLDWVHENELDLYHGACKRCAKAAKDRLVAQGVAEEVKPAEPDSEIVVAMRADHEAGMSIAKIARKHGFRYIAEVKGALGLPA